MKGIVVVRTPAYFSRDVSKQWQNTSAVGLTQSTGPTEQGYLLLNLTRSIAQNYSHWDTH